MGILKHKQGQLQVQETIIAVFIFIIIIIIGMSVFFKYQESSIQQDVKNFRLAQLGNSILTLPDTSEFVYTEDGKKISAVDTTKLLSLKSLVNKKKNYYIEKYGYKNITIIEVYPKPENTQECTEGTLENCGKWSIYNEIPQKYQGIQTSNIPKLRKETPISLYYPITEKFTIGILIVEEYQI